MSCEFIRKVNHMRILFTICARAGSKGVKNKNSRKFIGKPLVYYTLAAYKLFTNRYRDKFTNMDLAVNTDSAILLEQIKRTTISYTAIARKEELAGDRISKTDVVKDTLRHMEDQKGYRYDYVIDLDLTSPLRTVEDIWCMVDMAVKNSRADIIVSLAGSRRSPYFNMVEKKEDFYDIIIKTDFVSRQQAPVCYDMNASIYVYKRDFIADEHTKKVFDGKVLGWVMTDTAILDIDSEEDFELLEVLAEYFYHKKAEMQEIRSAIDTITDDSKHR